MITLAEELRAEEDVWRKWCAKDRDYNRPALKVLWNRAADLIERLQAEITRLDNTLRLKATVDRRNARMPGVQR